MHCLSNIVKKNYSRLCVIYFDNFLITCSGWKIEPNGFDLISSILRPCCKTSHKPKSPTFKLQKTLKSLKKLKIKPNINRTWYIFFPITLMGKNTTKWTNLPMKNLLISKLIFFIVRIWPTKFFFYFYYFSVIFFIISHNLRTKNDKNKVWGLKCKTMKFKRKRMVLGMGEQKTEKLIKPKKQKKNN
jgi:hypothetical protein